MADIKEQSNPAPGVADSEAVVIVWGTHTVAAVIVVRDTKFVVDMFVVRVRETMMLYLASPYTHPNVQIMELNVSEAALAAGKLIEAGRCLSRYPSARGPTVDPGTRIIANPAERILGAIVRRPALNRAFS